MALLTRDADRLEAALTGGPVAASVEADLALTHTLASVANRIGGPDAGFVASLRERLMAEAAAVFADEGAPLRAHDPMLPGAQRNPTRPSGRTAPGMRPARVVGLGRLRPLLSGAMALVAVACVLGLGGRSAIPGDALYPVRGALDEAAVALTGGNHDKGVTRLGQADRHLDDATLLATLGPDRRSDTTTALSDTGTAVAEARDLLTSDFAATGNTDSLFALQQFADEAVPRLEALRASAPPGLQEQIRQLAEIVSTIRGSALQTLSVCTTCGAAAQKAQLLLLQLAANGALPGGLSSFSGSTPSGSGSVLPGVPVSPSGTGGVLQSLVPPVSVPPPGVSVGVPGASVGVGGPGVSVGSGSVGVGGGGVTASLPVATATVPLPSVSLPLPSVPGVTLPKASVPSVPSVSVPSVSVPSVSVPSLPVPSVSVPNVLPSSSSTSPSSPSSSCLLVVCH